MLHYLFCAPTAYCCGAWVGYGIPRNRFKNVLANALREVANALRNGQNRAPETIKTRDTTEKQLGCYLALSDPNFDCLYPHVRDSSCPSRILIPKHGHVEESVGATVARNADGRNFSKFHDRGPKVQAPKGQVLVFLTMP